MKKVYIVTSGCYSDYRVEAVYSTEEKAKEYVDIQGSNYCIEEYILDPEMPEKEETWWSVILLCDNKEVQSAQKYSENFWNNNTIRYIKFPDMRKGDYYGIQIHVRADSQQRAVKIASERYGAIMANEQTVYPLLRAPLVNGNYPIYEFNTGCILIYDENEKENYPPFVQFKIYKKEE